MRLTKYVSTNILFLIGIIIFLLALPLLIMSYYYDGTSKVFGISLFEHRFLYLISIASLIFFIPIEILIHRVTHNKFILNIPFKNKNIKYLYNILFWLGITCSIIYLSFYIWVISKI